VERHAFVVVCDDLRVEINQKLIFIGVYPNHIAIPLDPFPIRQLVFYFVAESDIDDVMVPSAFEVILPGQERIRIAVPPVVAPTPPHDTFTRWAVKFPMLIQNPILKPGKILAKVLHNKGEITATCPWIVLAEQPLVAGSDPTN
jgi:hypothetical protein